MLALLLAAALLIPLAADRYVHRVASPHLYHADNLPPHHDVALVLGTSPTLQNGRRNLFFTYRIDAAAALFASGRAKHLLLSGDNHTTTYDEPTAMRDALLARGVPASAITLDYAGFRTLDSVLRARDVFGQSRIIIISQPFHCERAIYLARSAGIDASGYTAQDPAGIAATKVRARESLARVQAILDTTIFKTQPKFPGPAQPIQLVTN